MNEQKIDSNLEKCKNCGGNLVFDPSNQDLHCKSCNSHYPIVADGEIEYHDLYQVKEKDSQEYKEYREQNKVFKCSNCGANVVLNKLEIAKPCPYCGTALVASETTKIGLKPDAIIPFMFDEEEAGVRFKNTVKKRFFAPRQFKKALPENLIEGIYIPAFGFNANTFSSYNGELYNEREEKDSDGGSRTVRDYFHISGHLEKRYNDITVECSSNITQSELQGFLPYSFSNKKPYNNSFILGYSVEQYDKEVSDCISTYKSIMDNMIRRDILSKYHYDGISYLNVNTDVSDEKYQYHILPVYRFDYKYKKKDYVTYMNGQTGKVDGHTPKSALKIALVIAIPILIFILIVIISALSGGGS